MFTKQQFEENLARKIITKWGSFEEYQNSLLTEPELLAKEEEEKKVARKQDYLDWKQTLESKELADYNFVFSE